MALNIQVVSTVAAMTYKVQYAAAYPGVVALLPSNYEETGSNVALNGAADIATFSGTGAARSTYVPFVVGGLPQAPRAVEFKVLGAGADAIILGLYCYLEGGGYFGPPDLEALNLSPYDNEIVSYRSNGTTTGYSNGASGQPTYGVGDIIGVVVTEGGMVQFFKNGVAFGQEIGPNTDTGYAFSSAEIVVASVSSNSGAEGSNITHTVTLGSTTTDFLYLPYSLSGGTAAGGTDYTNVLTDEMLSAGVTLSEGELAVPEGVSSFTVTVPIATDADLEGNETYLLTVNGISGTGTITNVGGSPPPPPPAPPPPPPVPQLQSRVATVHQHTQGTASATWTIVHNLNYARTNPWSSVLPLQDGSIVLDGHATLGSPAPTYISGTSFSITGDLTPLFIPGTRARVTLTSGDVISTVTSVLFDDPDSTITLADSVLDNTLSAVAFNYPVYPIVDAYVNNTKVLPLTVTWLSNSTIQLTFSTPQAGFATVV